MIFDVARPAVRPQAELRGLDMLPLGFSCFGAGGAFSVVRFLDFVLGFCHWVYLLVR